MSDNSQEQSTPVGDRRLPANQNVVEAATPDVHLIKYDSACRALAEVSSVDEVKDILDRAVKLKLYGKIAENKQLERDAVALRLRAERRLGEMMAEQGEVIGKAKGGAEKGVGRRGNAGSDKTRISPPTLDEAGIGKNLANRARKLAKMPKREFEKRVAGMLNGDRGSLDIKRAAKRVKPTILGDDEDDGAASRVQSPKYYRSGFLSDAKLADRLARYDGPLQPGWAAEFAALAREVVARWTALADQLEQADRDAAEQAAVGSADDDHDGG